jgi:transposase-like protein
MRNILARIPHKEKKRFAERLKQIWLQPDKQSALSVATFLIQDYEKRFPEAIKSLEDGLEDSLQFYEFPEIDKWRISSTNVVERIIREIRRRSRVIGVFPNQESYFVKRRIVLRSKSAYSFTHPKALGLNTIASFLLLFCSLDHIIKVFQPVTLSIDIEDMSSVEEAIEDGRGGHLISGKDMV